MVSIPQEEEQQEDSLEQLLDEELEELNLADHAMDMVPELFYVDNSTDAYAPLADKTPLVTYAPMLDAAPTVDMYVEVLLEECFQCYLPPENVLEIIPEGRDPVSYKILQKIKSEKPTQIYAAPVYPVAMQR